MTEVRLDRRGNTFRVEVKGHAGYRGEKDIVCAAESILTGIMVQKLNEWEEDGALRMYRKEIGPGYVHVEFEPKGMTARKAGYMLDTILTGFSLLEYRYPEHVKILREKE